MIVAGEQDWLARRAARAADKLHKRHDYVEFQAGAEAVSSHGSVNIRTLPRRKCKQDEIEHNFLTTEGMLLDEVQIVRMMG